jgi:hypothetical protein
MSRIFALLTLASAAVAKESLDAKLHALSAKVQHKLEVECNDEIAECKDWCHSNGMAWEDKCDSSFHCCSGCPRCVATDNLLGNSFLLQSVADSDFCVHADGDLDEDVNLVWGSGCGHSAIKFNGLDAGNGNIVLHATANNDVVGDSTLCVRPFNRGHGAIAAADELVTNTDCNVNKANLQFKPVWSGELFQLQSVSDSTMCVHSETGSVGADAKLIFEKGCTTGLKFKAFPAPSTDAKP